MIARSGRFNSAASFFAFTSKSSGRSIVVRMHISLNIRRKYIKIPMKAILDIGVFCVIVLMMGALGMELIFEAYDPSDQKQ